MLWNRNYILFKHDRRAKARAEDKMQNIWISSQDPSQTLINSKNCQIGRNNLFCNKSLRVFFLLCWTRVNSKKTYSFSAHFESSIVKVTNSWEIIKFLQLNKSITRRDLIKMFTTFRAHLAQPGKYLIFFIQNELINRAKILKKLKLFFQRNHDLKLLDKIAVNVIIFLFITRHKFWNKMKPG